MLARARSEVVSLAEAHALLGLAGPTAEPALTAAFRKAVKAAHPSAADGDEARFRRVIAAWRLIQSPDARTLALAPPATPPPSPPVVSIGPMIALRGGPATVRLGGRTLRIQAPPGLRSGEHLRLRGAGAGGTDLYLPVLIRSADGLKAVGDDLFMEAPTPTRLLEDGGRLEIETHAGMRSAWIVAGQTSRLLRLRDLGLPARGARPQGCLFVTLRPSGDVPSAAEDLLIRFTRVWTPDRLAA